LTTVTSADKEGLAQEILGKEGLASSCKSKNSGRIIANQAKKLAPRDRTWSAPDGQHRRVRAI
jgi:hypothetical protein